MTAPANGDQASEKVAMRAATRLVIGGRLVEPTDLILFDPREDSIFVCNRAQASGLELRDLLDRGSILPEGKTRADTWAALVSTEHTPAKCRRQITGIIPIGPWLAAKQ